MSRVYQTEVLVLVSCMAAGVLACKGSEDTRSRVSAERIDKGSAALLEGRGPSASASKEVTADQPRPPVGPNTAAAPAPAEQAGSDSTVPSSPPAAAVATAAPATDAMEALFPQRHTRSEDVSEKAQRRIRYQLRDVARAPIALRDLIQVPRRDGGLEVYALYEYSVYEDCVKSTASRQEGRAKCLEEPVSVVIGTNPDHDEEDRDSRRYLYKQVRLGRECRKYGVVHAAFSPPPAGQEPGEAGALRVSSLPLPEIDCELQTLAQFFVDDVDGDHQPELYLDVTSARPSVRNQRGSYADDINVEDVTRKHHVLIVRTAAEALELQDKLDVVQSADAPPGSGLGVTLRELNRDGHLDLVAIGSCLVDLAAGKMYATEEVCQSEMRERIWYLYDREVDRWVLHGEPPLKRPWEETP